MPISIRKLPKQDLYRVYNPKTKEIHSYGTTLENAKKQITLLNMVDAGVPLDKKKGGECCCEMEGGSIQNPKMLELFKGKGMKNKISNKSIGMNSWVEHCKAFAKKKGIKYNEALKDPECKASYKKGEGLVSDVKSAVRSSAKKIGLGKCGMGVVDEAAAAGFADQVLIADAYNQKNLGAQKKYISL